MSESQGRACSSHPPPAAAAPALCPEPAWPEARRPPPPQEGLGAGTRTHEGFTYHRTPTPHNQTSCGEPTL